MAINLGPPPLRDTLVAASNTIGRQWQIWFSDIRNYIESFNNEFESHNHDDRYYTEEESDARFAAIVHTHTASEITDFSDAVISIGDGRYSLLGHRHSRLYDSTLTNTALDFDANSDGAFSGNASFLTNKKININDAWIYHDNTAAELKIQTTDYHDDIRIGTTSHTGSVIIEPGDLSGYTYLLNLNDYGSENFDGVMVQSSGAQFYRSLSDFSDDFFTIPVDYINFNTSYTVDGVTEGQLAWNSTYKTLDLVGPNGTVLQIGKETRKRVVNKQGSSIYNGQLVYISGSQGQRPAVKLALGNAHSTGCVVGMVTEEEIEDNQEGEITLIGGVNEINVDPGTFTDGDELWLSKTVAGAFTNEEPEVPHHCPRIGFVTNAHSIHGSVEINIQLHIEVTELSDVNGTPLSSSGQILVWDNDNQYFDFSHNLTKTVRSTGFVSRTDSTIAFDSGTRIFTLAPTGDTFNYYLDSYEYNGDTATVEIPDVTGLYFITMGSAGDLTASLTPWDISLGDAVPVATVYWNATINKGAMGDERHGSDRNLKMHEYLHETVGVRWASGLAATFNNTAFSVGIGEYYDEDIELLISSPETYCRVFWRNGSDWEFSDPTTLYYYTSGGNVYYDNSGTLTPVSANLYSAVWVFATNDPDYPIWVIVGQRQDTTIANARLNNTYASLALGTLPSQEMKLIYRVILRNDVTPYEEVADYRNVTNLPAGTYIATDHGLLTGLTDQDHPASAIFTDVSNFDGNLSASETTVQLALDKLDNPYKMFGSDRATLALSFDANQDGTFVGSALFATDEKIDFAGTLAGPYASIGYVTGTELLIEATQTGRDIHLKAPSTGSIVLEPGTYNAVDGVMFGSPTYTTTIRNIWQTNSNSGILDWVTADDTFFFQDKVKISHQLTSTLATGTSPFAVSSTTVNTNLNADLLDGQHGSYYATAAHGVTTGYAPYANAATTWATSPIFTDGTKVGIGDTSPTFKTSIVNSLGRTLYLGLNNSVPATMGTYTLLGTHYSGTGDGHLHAISSNASYAATMMHLECYRTSSNAYNFIKCTIDGDGTPSVGFNVAGDGSTAVGSGTTAYTTTVGGTQSSQFLVTKNTTNTTSAITAALRTGKTITSNGTYTNTAFDIATEIAISAGVTDSGNYATIRTAALRAVAADAGTLARLVSNTSTYGHWTGVHSSSTTTLAQGLSINGSFAAGTIGTAADIYIYAPTYTGATVTNEYCLYSAHDALSRFAGNIGIAADSRKMLFGAAYDASILYDGTNMVFNSREVGTGNFMFSGGNVGVGGNPEYMLDLQGAYPHINLYAKNNPSGNNNAVGILHMFYYSGTTSTSGTQIWLERESTVDGNYGTCIRFVTRQHGAAASEKLRITGAGYTGINTTAPRRRLDILDTSAAQARFTYTDNSVYGEITIDSSGNWSNDLTGTTWHLDSDKIIGLGNTAASPYAKLIYDTSTTPDELRLENTQSSGVTRIKSAASGSIILEAGSGGGTGSINMLYGSGGVCNIGDTGYAYFQIDYYGNTYWEGGYPHIPTKSDTGDPTGVDGRMYINTYDNAVRIYADGAWRSLITW